jgi:hypothetical protein
LYDKTGVDEVMEKSRSKPGRGDLSVILSPMLRAPSI